MDIKSISTHSLAAACVGLMALCSPAPDRISGGLSEAYARYRARRVAAVSYDLQFRLDAAGEEFTGRSKIAFEWSGTSGEPLSVDFTAGTVTGLRVNGQAAKIVYNDHYIDLPPESLRTGANEIEIEFAHPYSKNGKGLYRFRDPADGRTYLFTDFQPYHANQLFPCFDQPDLKADYKVSVDVPEAWEVVSGVREDKIENADAGRRRWHFPRGARYSTYIFALHAGAYAYRESSAPRKRTGAAPANAKRLGPTISLRLYYRKSRAKYVDYEEWFLVTRQGLAFFQDYFDLPLPYAKYDQLLVPDFNIGAMENVGAITFNERYAPRGKPTYALRERRANVILHEMAHMWFGNLVTNRWWDDLWLNESFATYMAYLSLDAATEFKTAWRSFFARSKQWAYYEDDLVTTHPIVTPVRDTATAFVNFDGITYGKGAATLKQLAYFLSAESYRDGVRLYFKKHAGGNTVMSDFTGSLAAAAAVDLDAWNENWLRRAGTNRIRTDFVCRDGNLRELSIIQTAPEDHSTLRAHRLRIALIDRGKENDGLVVSSVLDGRIAGERTAVKLPEGVSTPCPLAVFPNYEDHAFARILLDPTSRDLFQREWHRIEDPLLRAQIWQTFWHMLRDAKLPVNAFARLSLEGLPAESDPVIAGLITYRTNDLIHYLNRTANQPPARESGELEAAIFKKLEKAAPGSPLQKLWWGASVDVAHTPGGLAEMRRLLSGERKLAGLEIDQDKRWSIIRVLARRESSQAISRETPGATSSDILDLIAAEEARDKSEGGARSALAARVSRPDPGVKHLWFDRMTAGEPDESMSLARQRAVLYALFSRDRPDLQRPFANAFFEKIPELVESRDENFLRTYIALAPTFCEVESAERLAAFNRANPDLPPILRKGLLVAAQEDERCVRIRDFARAGTDSK